jgi:glycosyltransferase involved in cell wall biosynthesis
MRASIIIPTYQHAAWVREAIACALAQTVTCDVIVVDDGSTDDTPAVLATFGDRIRVLTQDHRGPCAARNAGLEAALGEYVMFLDADDLVAPTKVQAQLEVLDHAPLLGWALCDVSIEDEAKGQTTTASAKYDYAGKELGGWIQPLLTAGNFIPIMSPLVRRSALETIRFEDGRVPEDWHFWHAVAGVLRVAYVPKILATYRHRRTGRSRLPKKARAVSPNLTAPLRLNLGCGTQSTRSWNPIPGLVNLDKSLGWRFEDGLGDFIDRSVAGITVSHALMYVAEADWPAVCREFARVLVDGGVVRITEDSTADPRSRRLGGWQGSEPAVTLTSPAFVRAQLERTGLAVTDVTRETTQFADRSLCQAQHGEAPDVFFIEGVKMTGVLFAPHNDDETLFAAFTILRNRPHVVVCFASSGDYGDPREREAETRDAMSVLGAGSVEQWAGGDLASQMRAYDARVHPTRVWAPNDLASHPDHVAVARAARAVFGDRVTTYHTYVDGEKIRRGRQVDVEVGWASYKLRALARYQTQLRHPRGHAFFLNDLHEYAGTDREGV